MISVIATMSFIFLCPLSTSGLGVVWNGVGQANEPRCERDKGISAIGENALAVGAVRSIFLNHDLIMRIRSAKPLASIFF
ncbi:MAG: hypothetical protein AAGC70_19755 [Pseudomonadota bacterium]